MHVEGHATCRLEDAPMQPVDSSDSSLFFLLLPFSHWTRLLVLLQRRRRASSLRDDFCKMDALVRGKRGDSGCWYPSIDWTGVAPPLRCSVGSLAFIWSDVGGGRLIDSGLRFYLDHGCPGRGWEMGNGTGMATRSPREAWRNCSFLKYGYY